MRSDAVGNRQRTTNNDMNRSCKKANHNRKRKHATGSRSETEPNDVPSPAMSSSPEEENPKSESSDDEMVRAIRSQYEYNTEVLSRLMSIPIPTGKKYTYGSALKSLRKWRKLLTFAHYVTVAKVLENVKQRAVFMVLRRTKRDCFLWLSGIQVPEQTKLLYSRLALDYAYDPCAGLDDVESSDSD